MFFAHRSAGIVPAAYLLLRGNAGTRLAHPG